MLSDKYDAIEAQTLLFEGGDYRPCTVEIANTFSVYWHLVEGGVEQPLLLFA